MRIEPYRWCDVTTISSENAVTSSSRRLLTGKRCIALTFFGAAGSRQEHAAMSHWQQRRRMVSVGTSPPSVHCPLLNSFPSLNRSLNNFAFHPTHPTKLVFFMGERYAEPKNSVRRILARWLSKLANACIHFAFSTRAFSTRDCRGVQAGAGVSCIGLSPRRMLGNSCGPGAQAACILDSPMNCSPGILGCK